MVVIAAVLGIAVVAVKGASAAKVVPHRMVAQAGATRAVLLYVPWPDDYLMKPRLQIGRGGRLRFAEVVPPSRWDNPRYARVIPNGLNARPLAVRDLEGDREPEVVLDLYWGGAHCCWWTRVYRLDRTRGTYVPRNHWWGEAKARSRVRDLDRDGAPEFVAADDRFMQLSYFSADPIQVWSYDDGRFRDVTRRFPRQIARDARRWWGAYPDYRRKKRWVREPLAAWTADQYLLGQRRKADRVLARAIRRGDLRGSRVWVERPRDPHTYVAQLKTFLRKTGYAEPAAASSRARTSARPARSACRRAGSSRCQAVRALPRARLP